VGRIDNSTTSSSSRAEEVGRMDNSTTSSSSRAEEVGRMDSSRIQDDRTTSSSSRTSVLSSGVSSSRTCEEQGIKKARLVGSVRQSESVHGPELRNETTPSHHHWYSPRVGWDSRAHRRLPLYESPRRDEIGSQGDERNSSRIPEEEDLSESSVRVEEQRVLDSGKRRLNMEDAIGKTIEIFTGVKFKDRDVDDALMEGVRELCREANIEGDEELCEDDALEWAEGFTIPEEVVQKDEEDLEAHGDVFDDFIRSRAAEVAGGRMSVKSINDWISEDNGFKLRERDVETV